MKSETLLEALQYMELTRSLEPKHLEKLAGMAFEATFSKGETIFSEGDLGDALYLIRTGRAAVETYVPGQGRVTILTVGPGQLLGWSALFPNKHKTASSQALMDTQVIALSASQLRAACQEDCELGYAVIWRIAELVANRLKATRLQLIDVFAPGGEKYKENI